MSVKASHILSKIFGFFLRGLIFVTPILITVYSIVVIVKFFDGLIPGLYPGLSIVIVLLTITFIGYYSYTILFKSILTLIESVILKTPGLKLIYSSIKDLLGALVGNKRTFNQVVMVMMVKESGLQRIGFITKQDLSEVGIHNLVAVYFPDSYAFAGNLYLVPRENVTLLKDFPAADAMKFIVSGGVTDLISREDDENKKS